MKVRDQRVVGSNLLPRASSARATAETFRPQVSGSPDGIHLQQDLTDVPVVAFIRFTCDRFFLEQQVAGAPVSIAINARQALIGLILRVATPATRTRTTIHAAE